MTSFTETWNTAYEASPADTDTASQGAGKIRASRKNTRERLDVEHYNAVTDGVNQGIHKFPTGNTAGRPSELKTGRIYGNTQRNGLEFYDGSAWMDGGGLEAGVKTPFFQASAPAGWTQDTTQNDKVFRVVSGTGGGVGGNWTLTGVTVDGAVLSEAQMPAHKHFTVHNSSGTATPVSNLRAIQKDNLSASNNNERYILGGSTGTPTLGKTDTVGSSNSHNHGVTSDAAWRPAYINVLIATRD